MARTTARERRAPTSTSRHVRLRCAWRWRLQRDARALDEVWPITRGVQTEREQLAALARCAAGHRDVQELVEHVAAERRARRHVEGRARIQEASQDVGVAARLDCG